MDIELFDMDHTQSFSDHQFEKEIEEIWFDTRRENL